MRTKLTAQQVAPGCYLYRGFTITGPGQFSKGFCVFIVNPRDPGVIFFRSLNKAEKGIDKLVTGKD